MVNKIKLIGISILMSLSLHSSYGCDDKTLDINAGACSTKLWSGIPISRTDIEESLGFISNLHHLDKNYGQEQEFSNFLERSKATIQDRVYENFSHECSILFNESLNQSRKIALHILLEKVADIYGKELKQSRILKEREEASKVNHEFKAAQTFNADKFLDEFLNADKAIHSH